MPSVGTICKNLLKRALLVGALAGFLHYSYTISRVGLPPEHLQNAVSATVQILDKHKHVMGAGFTIDKDGTIVTAGHIFKNTLKSDKVFVRFFGNLNACPAKILVATLEPDMAVVQADYRCNVRSWVKIIRSDDVVRGEKVHLVGHPRKIPWTVSETVVSSKDYANGQYYIVVAAQILGGSSGGPVVNRDGKIIGMVVSSQMTAGILRTRSAFSYTLPGTDMLRYLEIP